LWLVDQKQHDLVFGNEINRLASPSRKGERIPIDAASINGYVALTGESHLSPDVKQDDHYRQILEGVQSELAVPLRRDSRVIGTLNVESFQRAAFTDNHQRLLEALASQAAIAIEDAHLYDRLETLIEVGQTLTRGSRLTESEVLDLICKQADKLMDAGNMYIALYDEASDTVRFGLVYVGGERIDVDNDPGWQLRKAGKGKTEEIIRSKQPIFTATKAESEAWYQQPGREAYAVNTPASWLGVPMIVSDKAVGVIAIYHLTIDNVYTAEDLRILEALANQAAIALDNSRMFYRVNQRLEALVEFGQSITKGLRLHESEVLQLIRDQACQLMDTDNMYIALYDETSDIVRFGLAYVEGERIDVKNDPRWQPRKTGKGKTEEIIHTQQPIFTATMAESRAWYQQLGREEYVGASFASWLGVPMIIGKKVLGVVATYHPTRDYVYSGDDLTVLQGLAIQAAIALDNSHMFYRVNQRLEALVKFGQSITAGLRLHEDQVLQLIREQASQLMDTNNMYIALYDKASDIARFGLAYVDGDQIDVKNDPRWQPRKAGKGRTEEIIRSKQP
jgi:GAF domain-containing protein